MNRREQIRRYKETPRPMGVFRVHNTLTGRSLVGTGTDLPAILNRHRFQLRNGLHPSRALQRDFTALGAEAFVFETLDTLPPAEQPGQDPAEELRLLRDLWVERLGLAAAQLYPERGGE